MKNRNLILSVLFWLVASVCMAITLPSSSYSSDFIDPTSDNESYVSNIGTQIMNHAILSAYNGECDIYREGGEAWKGDADECNKCCEINYPSGVDREGRRECMLKCNVPLGLPLGTPLMLLPFIAVYAFVRRRKQA